MLIGILRRNTHVSAVFFRACADLARQHTQTPRNKAETVVGEGAPWNSLPPAVLKRKLFSGICI
jgi:hypothetical protein